MKLIKIGLLIVSLGCCVACSADIDVQTTDSVEEQKPESAESNDSETTQTDTGEKTIPGDTGEKTTPSPAESSVPDAVKALLQSKCNDRPDPRHVSGTMSGVAFEYTEVLAEEDVGSANVVGSKLFALNPEGILYVEPSQDGKVHWAARKWTLAESQEKAADFLKELKIESKPDGAWTTITVGHPVIQSPGPRYKACLVIKAPATWIHDLRQVSGFLESVDHEGVLFTTNQSGTTLINSKGEAEIIAYAGSGAISVIQQGSGPVNVESGSGNITISQMGSGSLTVVNQSGSIDIEADSRSLFNVSASSGGVQYTLFNGQAPLQGDSSITTGSGSISLEIKPGIGFHFDAEVQNGSLSLPSTYPTPEVVETVGEKVIADINGGGKLLKLRATTGSISVRGE